MVSDINAVLNANRVISTERLLLREFRESDAEAMFEWASDPQCTEFLTWPPHADLSATLNVLRELFIGKPEVFCIELKQMNKCIGCIDLRIDIKNEKTSFGYVLGRPHWNKGLMTEVVKRLIDLSFTDLEVNRVEAQHYVGNEGSGRVMEKAGMKIEGVSPEYVKVKGKFQDMVHYGILRSKRSSEI